MTAALAGRQHVPDILDCLAQLSNDEVPTPPKLARAMLDLLPEEVWRTRTTGGSTRSASPASSCARSPRGCC